MTAKTHFLVTTADERTWAFGKEILFLGDWCKRFSRRARWENLSHEVMPFHWDDRNKLHRDFIYIISFYERCLEALATLLNREHSVNYPTRYWRIFAGPWILTYLQSFYERFESIQIVAKNYDVSGTNILKYSHQDMVVNDMLEYIDLISSDDFNHILYSEAVRALDLFPFTILPETLKPIDQSPLAPSVTRPKMSLTEKIAAIPGRWNRMVFVSSYFKFSDQVKLQLSLRQWPSLSPWNFRTTKNEVDIKKRESLHLDVKSLNVFEKYIAENILKFIPYSHLEGYARMRSQIDHQNWPRRPTLIVSAGNLSFADGFKLYTAEKTATGAQLASIQHGGHYGTGLWNNLEKHEVAISDVFYSSGWSDPVHENVKPLPSSRLLRNTKGLSASPHGDFIWVLTTFARYSFHLFSIPIASQVLNYLDEQYRFLRSLDPAWQKKILARLYPANYGWDEEERWKTFFPELRFDKEKQPINRQLCRSSLCIVTNNTTTLMETLAANYPTVIFWNPNHWEIRPEASGAYQALLEAGILHHSPESAAKLVNEIGGNIPKWWSQDHIQKARLHFCSQYALMTPHWLNQWRRALLDLEKKRSSKAIFG